MFDFDVRYYCNIDIAMVDFIAIMVNNYHCNFDFIVITIIIAVFDLIVINYIAAMFDFIAQESERRTRELERTVEDQVSRHSEEVEMKDKEVR